MWRGARPRACPSPRQDRQLYQHESGRPGTRAAATPLPRSPPVPGPQPPPTAPVNPATSAPAAPSEASGAAGPPAAAPLAGPVPTAGALGAPASLVAVDVTGAEAEAFLQGQLSNDVVALGGASALLAGWCSPKGRLLAAPAVHRLPHGYRLALPADLADGFVRRLRMFVLRAAVTVAAREDLAALALFAASPADARAVPWPAGLGDAAAGLARGEPLGAALGEGDASILRWHDLPGAPGGAGPLARLLAFVPVAEADPERLTSGTGLEALPAPRADALWRLGDVRAGIASVRAATADAFVPQTVNFGEAGGLSFRKGCYPGQEIVARMQYLGKLKRHARAFRGPATGEDDVPAPGRVLDARGPDGEPLERAAEVVDAVLADGAVELLAVVRVDAGALEPVSGAAALRPVDLPYEPPGAGEARGRVAAGAAGPAAGAAPEAGS